MPLTPEDVLSQTGDLGVGPIRDIGLLDSAMRRPQVTGCGHESYAIIEANKRLMDIGSSDRNNQLRVR